MTSTTLEPDRTHAAAPFDAVRVRADFPVLATPGLVYLDSAATSQKPQAVIDRVSRFYAAENANIHRGVYALSAEATAMYEGTRETIARFLNAPSSREVIFTRGTTEGINLVAQSWARSTLRAGDEILISAMEHHSNIVPWQLVCEQTGAVLRVIPVNEAGELDIAAFGELLTERTRLVAIVHLSNALGTVNPITELARLAHAVGALVLVDGAQSAPHLHVDMQALGCDFFVCSGHKLFGPTGIGVLWGREALLERMPPWQGGGDMIERVTFERSTWAALPSKFEPGTPHIAGVAGLGAAIEYLDRLDWPAMMAHEEALLAEATARVHQIPGLRVVGTARHKASVLSFWMDAAHPHDIATVLDGHGIAIRAGHHCAQPLMHRYGLPATARASFAFYNMRDDVDALIHALEDVRARFA